jgi:hypothetical protein
MHELNGFSGGCGSRKIVARLLSLPAAASEEFRSWRRLQPYS